MSTYTHLQDAKKNESLPDADKLGVCLTCKYWNAETPRPPQGLVQKIAVCELPELKPYALLVSGSSGCDKWAEQPAAGPEAKQYAEQGH